MTEQLSAVDLKREVLDFYLQEVWSMGSLQTPLGPRASVRTSRDVGVSVASTWNRLCCAVAVMPSASTAPFVPVLAFALVSRTIWRLSWLVTYEIVLGSRFSLAFQTFTILNDTPQAHLPVRRLAMGFAARYISFWEVSLVVSHPTPRWRSARSVQAYYACSPARA